jgi:hypothetical protein
MRYIGELERKVQTLQTEATTLSAQLALLQVHTITLEFLSQLANKSFWMGRTEFHICVKLAPRVLFYLITLELRNWF